MASSEVLLKEPGQFIAAVPALLGFVPQRSLVVVVLRRPQPETPHEVHVAVRLDLPTADRYSPLSRRVVQICRRSDAVAALVVVVDDRITRPEGRRGASTPVRYLAERLREDLAEFDIALLGAWAVPSITVAAQWHNVDEPQSCGILPDPLASQLAARQVYDGLMQHSSREELAASIAVDEKLRERVSDALPAVVADAQRRLARAIQINNPDAYTRMNLWQVMSVITRTYEAVEIPAHTIAEVAVALRDKDVRDVMFGVAGGAHAQAAERLWDVLTRALPAPDRAEAATLLAFHAYLRGDGALAGVALEQALASDPEHHMAVLLDTALQTAMNPARLNRLVRTGIAAAADLRIDIGHAATDSETEAAR